MIMTFEEMVFHSLCCLAAKCQTFILTVLRMQHLRSDAQEPSFFVFNSFTVMSTLQHLLTVSNYTMKRDISNCTANIQLAATLHCVYQFWSVCWWESAHMIRLLACVYPQVALQRLQVAEARAADVTRVRFLSSVDQYVSPQMSHLGNQKEEDEAPWHEGFSAEMVWEFVFTWTKREPQVSHLYGFSPEWIRECVFRLAGLLNWAPHTLQRYGFSPVIINHLENVQTATGFRERRWRIFCLFTCVDGLVAS